MRSTLIRRKIENVHLEIFNVLLKGKVSFGVIHFT